MLRSPRASRGQVFRFTCERLEARLVLTPLLPPLVEGDYDNNGQLGAGDLDLQAIAIAGGQHPYVYDLTDEGVVNYTDRRVWLKDLYGTYVGDADLNHEYSSADWVTVFVIGKYGLNELATWAEGDFNGDQRFDGGDLLAVLQDGVYEDPHPGFGDPGFGNGQPLLPNGVIGDGQMSIVYDTDTGELSVDVPSNGHLTTLEIESAVPIFWNSTPAELSGSFDVYRPNKLFKSDASSFGSMSFGPLAMQAGLSEAFVLNELRVDGSLSPGGDLGPVDLVYLSTGSSVSNPPIANDDDITVTLETPVTIDVLANDFNPSPAGVIDVTSVQVVAAPANGTVHVNSATGDVTYIHNPHWFVGGSFTYTVKDDAGAVSNVATVDVAVDCGDLRQNQLAPNGVIGDGITSIVYDSDTGELAVDVPSAGLLSALEIRSSSGVFTGPTPAVLAGSFDVYTPPKLFKLDVNGWGSTSFGPVMQAGLTESFLLDDLLVDGAWTTGGPSCMEDFVYLSATTPVNNPPVALDDTTAAVFNTPITIDVLANDFDPDPADTVDATSVQIGVAPANGAVAVNPTTGEVTYTPNLNFNGPDGFTYTVRDDDGAPSNVASVTVIIPAPPPSVIDVRALFGSQSYSLMNNSDVLPWINIMAIDVVFDTLVVIKEADLRLAGVSGGLYDGQLSGGHELADLLITDTATLTLANPIGADRLTLSLDGDDDSSDGNVGVSGGGAYLQGGDFSLDLNVLPGDVYQTGSSWGRVNVSDIIDTRYRILEAVGDPLYSVLNDVDGNARIDLLDLIYIRQRQLTSLPSTVALPMAVADAVFSNDTDRQSSETEQDEAVRVDELMVLDAADPSLTGLNDLAGSARLPPTRKGCEWVS